MSTAPPPPPATPDSADAPGTLTLPRGVWTLVAGLTLLAFWPVIPGYLSAEDFYWVPRLAHVPFANTLRQQWLLEQIPGDYDPQDFLQFYRPIGYMWVHLKVALWRAWLPGLRVDHLLLNVAGGVGTAALALRWIGDRRAALMAGAFMAVGAGHIRPLTVLSGTNILWAGLAAIGIALWTERAITTGRRGPLLVSCTIALAGVLCYEQVIVLPLLAVGVGWLRRVGPPANYVQPAVAAGVLTAAFFAFRFVLYGGVGGYQDIQGTPHMEMSSLALLLVEVSRAVWIAAQSFAMPFQPPAVHLPRIVTWGAVALWGIGLGIVWRRHRAFRGTILSAVLWIVVTSAPTTGLLTAPDHWTQYLYLGSIGSSVLLALLIHGAVPVQWQRLTAGMVVAAYVGITWAGLQQYREAWHIGKRFVTQLQALVPPEDTPAFAYVENLPGMDPEGGGRHVFLSPPNHDAYTGYLPNALWLRRTPVEWPSGIPYSGDRPVPPADALRFHWLRWDETTLRLDQLAPPAAPRPGQPIRWDFTQPRDAARWKKSFGFMGTRGGPPGRYVTDGEWAMLAGPNLPPTLGTPIYADLTMRVTVPEGRAKKGIAEWHFRTAAEPEASPAHVIRFWVRQDGQTHTYRVPLVNNPQLLLDGPPTRLDLRPTSTPGAVVQITAIGLTPQTLQPDA